MNRVCPLLGLLGDRRSAIDAADPAHRCHADTPAPIDRQWQATYCLTPTHPQCERYQQALTRRGTRVLGRAPIGDGLASTRLLLSPEPPWRGMAGRARRRGVRRAAAVGSAIAVVAAATVAVANTSNGTGSGADASAPASAVVGAAPASPRPPAPTTGATSVPTPTPAPLTPAATESPTPVPTATPVVQARTHVVEAGDTLLDIANRFDTSVDAILGANDLEDADVLTVGETLVIP